MTEYEKQLMLEWNRLPSYMRKIGDLYLDIRRMRRISLPLRLPFLCVKSILVRKI